MDVCIPPLQLPPGDINICSGSDNQFVGSALFNYWCQHDCPTAFSNYLNTLDNGEVGYNPNHFNNLQFLVKNLFTVYGFTNKITNNRSDISYNPFQNTLLSTCLDNRLTGICDRALNPTYNGFCSDVTTTNLNDTTLNFCGCYVNSNSPTKISGTNPSCQNDPCDPLCHRISTVQRVGTDGQICSCSNNVCAINDVLINSINSSVGSSNITNLCPYCGPDGGCTCIISGNDVTSVLTDIGLGTQFNQYCGGNSRCFVNQNGTLEEIPCSTANPNNQNVSFTFKFPWVWVVIIIIIFLILGLLIWSIYDKPSITIPSQRTPVTTPVTTLSQRTPITTSVSIPPQRTSMAIPPQRIPVTRTPIL